jgi:hypothetical protein
LRRLGLLGACEEERAFVEDELIRNAIRFLANHPDVRRIILREVGTEIVTHHRARFACRLATGVTVSALLSLTGPWGAPAGAGLGTAAAFGSVHRLVEDAIGSVGADDLLRAGLLGS